MGSFSLIHWVVLILVVMLLFRRGRISDLMGDFAKGINSFKKGLADGDSPPPPQATPQITPLVTNAGVVPVAPATDTTVNEVRR